jgi:periplasmic copper chaperone A
MPATGTPADIGAQPRRAPVPLARRARQAARVARSVAAAAGLAAIVAVTGCAAHAATTAAAPIKIGSAYVPVPVSAGTTVAYVVIRNNGAADRLLSARTSAGGRVALRAPARPGDLSMRTVGSIAIPAHSTLAMVPDGYHMLITGATRPIRGGKDITLTLLFAHAGRVPVVVQVTNPAIGGSTYLFN